jgi:sulfur transfer complex TusBCD TusB component (DsrH family)
MPHTLLQEMAMSGSKRAQYLVAMLLIGDGVTAALSPRRYTKAWKAGPKPWRQLMESLAKRPDLTRGLALVEAAAGAYWAMKLSDQ